MFEANPLPITSTLIGALVILLVMLSGLVTARRATLGGVQFGDADDAELRHRIRAHGNFVEIAPFVVFAIGAMELAGASAALLWSMAGAFFIGRVLHATRMYARRLWPGLIAIISQHVICLVAGAWLLGHFLF